MNGTLIMAYKLSVFEILRDFLYYHGCT